MSDQSSYIMGLTKPWLRYMLGNTKLLFSDDDKEFEVDFSAGIAPTSQTKKRSAIESSDSSKQAEPSKPAIVFRKRKVR